MRKDWIERELTIEIIVGAFILMIFLGIGYFTIILSREAWFGNKPTMEILFKNVMGLREGDSVVVRGMQVGKVKKLGLEKSTVIVKVVLDPGTRLEFGTDYKISIIATSLLGGRHLEIDEGSGNAPNLPEGSPFHGREPYDIISDAAELVNSARKNFVEGGVLDNMKTASEDLKTVTSRLSGGKGSVGKLLSEDETLYNDLASATKSGRGILEKINNAEGTIGKLVGEDSLYRDIKGVVEDVRCVIDDFRETTPVVTFTSIFFGAF